MKAYELTLGDIQKICKDRYQNMLVKMDKMCDGCPIQEICFECLNGTPAYDSDWSEEVLNHEIPIHIQL